MRWLCLLIVLCGCGPAPITVRRDPRTPPPPPQHDPEISESEYAYINQFWTGDPDMEALLSKALSDGKITKSEKLKMTEWRNALSDLRNTGEKAKLIKSLKDE